MLPFLAVILILTASACAKKMNMEFKTESSKNGAKYDVADSGSTSGTADRSMTEEEAVGFLSGNTQTNKDNSGQIQDKIIRTFELDVETMEFDGLIRRIDSEISRLGGYVENSSISGKRYYDSGARYANITARIPSDKVDEFVGLVGENANVINSQGSSKNVSLEYIDTESRIKALKIEQERLYAILEKELDLKNIITLESRLSEIRYELQNYESKLRYYDNQVAYSTVTLFIQEVEKLTPKTEIKQSVGTRIKNGLSDTFYNISEGLKNFLVWFVVNLPYMIIWAVIIAIIVLIILKLIKRLDPYRDIRNDRKTKKKDNIADTAKNESAGNNPENNEENSGSQQQ